MNTTTRPQTAERFGRWLGRGWRGYVRGERRALAWVISKGIPVAVATVLIWAVKLAVLCVLLYVVFWIAVLGVSIAVGLWVASQNYSDDEEVLTFTDLTELRNMSGYDPNLYGDSSHVLYTDD